MQLHPKPPTGSLKEVFNAARILRTCSNLPYLVKIVSQVPPGTMVRTNQSISLYCASSVDGRLIEGCFLDIYYKDIIRCAPKLQTIKKILLLEKNVGKPMLILSPLPEMLLIVEWVCFLSLYENGYAARQADEREVASKAATAAKFWATPPGVVARSPIGFTDRSWTS